MSEARVQGRESTRNAVQRSWRFRYGQFILLHYFLLVLACFKEGLHGGATEGGLFESGCGVLRAVVQLKRGDYLTTAIRLAYLKKI